MKPLSAANQHGTGEAPAGDGHPVEPVRDDEAGARLAEDSARICREIAEVARFPEENPNPVFRVAADGCVAYANRASSALMAAWQVAEDGCVPAPWQERMASVLASGEARKWDAACGDQVLQLHCVPVLSGGYVNVYASDVTERVRARQLESEQRRAAEMRAAQLEATLDAINEGVILYDAQGRVLRMNSAAEPILGYHPGAIALSLAQRAALIQATIVDDPHADVAQFPLPRGLRGETVRGQLMRFRPAGDEEGHERYVLASAVPVVGSDGEQLGVVASFADVTELRRARDMLEQRVRERTAELEAIFESVPDSLYVANRNGIVRANGAALASFGVDSLEELQQRPGSLAETMQARTVGTGKPIPHERLALTRALNGERVVHEVVSRNPKTNQDQIHRIATAPIVVNGETVGAVGIATDITEQKRTQAEIAYQANLLANVNDAILAYDGELRVTAWNRGAEELYGWTAAEAIGAYAPAIAGSRMTDAERADSMHSLLATGRWQGEVRHTRRDGTPITIESTSMALRDEAGRIYTFVTVNRDITRRKEMELQNARLLEEVKAGREQLQALSRRLVAMQEAERSYVADQLYNQAGQVLAALRWQLARLDKKDQGTGEQPDAIGAALDEAIRELHDLASQLRPVSLNRSTLARALKEQVSEFAGQHGLEVRYEPGNAELLRPPEDVATALFRGVQEGLLNVAHHARATQITLALRSDEDVLTVTLADDGVGFDSERVGQEGGLGLASIRERLKMIGGQLTIATGSMGTTLHMEAPLSMEESVA